MLRVAKTMMQAEVVYGSNARRVRSMIREDAGEVDGVDDGYSGSLEDAGLVGRKAISRTADAPKCLAEEERERERENGRDDQRWGTIMELSDGAGGSKGSKFRLSMRTV